MEKSRGMSWVRDCSLFRLGGEKVFRKRNWKSEETKAEIKTRLDRASGRDADGILSRGFMRCCRLILWRLGQLRIPSWKRRDQLMRPAGPGTDESRCSGWQLDKRDDSTAGRNGLLFFSTPQQPREWAGGGKYLEGCIRCCTAPAHRGAGVATGLCFSRYGCI